VPALPAVSAVAALLNMEYEPLSKLEHVLNTELKKYALRIGIEPSAVLQLPGSTLNGAYLRPL
jgi:hypothetical protein